MRSVGAQAARSAGCFSQTAHDLIALCNKHNDCQFLCFTNATLIDEDFADQMLRVKNFVPAISVEGFEEATDSRRGAGTYQAVMKAMQVLKEHKLPFGICQLI